MDIWLQSHGSKAVRRAMLAAAGLLLITPIPARAAAVLCGDTITVGYTAEGAISGSEDFTACSNAVVFIGLLASGGSVDEYEFEVSASEDSIQLSITSIDTSDGFIYEMPSSVTLQLTSINWFGMPGVTIQSVIDNSPFFDIVSSGPDFLTIATIPGGIPDQTPGFSGDSVTLPLGSFGLVPTAAVPEPSMLALVGFGVSALACRRRTRRFARHPSPHPGD